MGRKLLWVLLAVLLLVPRAHAAPDSDPDNTIHEAELQNPFSDYVPFEDERDVDEAERFMYFGRFFGIALGTGIHQFGGNIGKLYNTALPVMDLRLIHFFDFRFAGQLGITNASHAFSTSVLGDVDVNIFSLNFDAKYYIDTKDMGAAITTANPYLIAGISQNFRTQVFQTSQNIQKDNAFGVSAGGGVEFTLKPRKTSLGFEGRIHELFFKDRAQQTYAPVGVEDTTGAMYSMTTSIIFFF